ncbi:MAG TPA: hypothetical protein VJV78_36485 [Polyangiales bacterium]|nr:hypothetical protein [Polyangiales bacterium]
MTAGARRLEDAGVCRVGLWAGLVLAVAACSSAPRPVARWAKHIKSPKVDAEATLDAYESVLVGELKSGVYRPLHDTPPEQIAVLAVHELQLDHPWDAAVLLALASYRRREQAWATRVYGNTQGWQMATEGSHGRIERKEYDDFLNNELRALYASTFDDALGRISSKVGAPIWKQDVDRDTQRLVTGHAGDAAGVEQALYERAQVLAAPPPERVVHSQLADALREYLRASVKMHRSKNDENDLADSAANYLAEVPLLSFRRASLQSAAYVFSGSIVRAGLFLYKQSPEDVSAALRMNRFASRAHAAVILGMVGDPAYVPELQAGWEKEQLKLTRLSFAFALAALGDKERAADLLAAARSSDPDVVEHAVTLIDWLPEAARSFEVEPLMADVLRGKDATWTARYLAMVELRNLSKERALSDATLRAVLDVTYQLRDKPDELEAIAEMVGELAQLDRARVLRALHASQQPLEPWLARFVRVAQPSDLPQIEAWLDDSDYEKAHAMLVRAAARIPGEKAQSWLEKWLVEYPELDRTIAWGLSIHEKADKQRLLALLEQSDLPAGALILELALDRPSAGPRLSKFLSSSDLDERISATLAIQLFGTPQHADGVWQNIAFHDARYYLHDLRLRQMSLCALLDVELNRTGGMRVQPTW